LVDEISTQPIDCDHANGSLRRRVKVTEDKTSRAFETARAATDDVMTTPDDFRVIKTFKLKSAALAGSRQRQRG
jgi:hypothetical protein